VLAVAVAVAVACVRALVLVGAHIITAPPYAAARGWVIWGQVHVVAEHALGVSLEQVSDICYYIISSSSSAPVLESVGVPTARTALGPRGRAMR
jgi:hypothetical protein